MFPRWIALVGFDLAVLQCPQNPLYRVLIPTRYAMNQIRGLLRDTWWLWLVFSAFVILAMILFTTFYAVCFPFLVGMMIYFALMRYDKNGEYRGESLGKDP